MNWKHPFNMPANTPTITGMAPGEMLEKSIGEIQSKVVCAVLPSGEASGEEGDLTEVKIEIENAGPNAVRVKGSVMIPTPDVPSPLPEPDTEHYVLTVYGGEWVCGPIRAL